MLLLRSTTIYYLAKIMANSRLVWILFTAITILLGIFFLRYPPIYYGGDLAEYYGTTESFLNHGTPQLTNQDRINLEKVVNPVNFIDPLYYIKGTDGNRYPVHFIFYSLLSLPVRIVLKLFQLPEINSLRMTNFIILEATLYIVLKRFIKSPFRQLLFLTTIYLSPLISFIIWPGPDLYYLCLLLIGVFCFYERKYFLASLLVVLASWHSQPLVILASTSIAYYVFHKGIIPSPKTVAISLLLIFLMLVPYAYNYILFGNLTPWVIFQDGWTKEYGFRLQNVSIKKLFEQFFDLNMGLFWYAPVLLFTGIYFLKNDMLVNKKSILLIIILFLNTFFYQTNPAWHYGTSGFGPTRHILYFLPFLIFFFVTCLKPTKNHLIVLCLFIISQLYVLSFNGFITPDFIKVLYHSPYAEYVLNNYPNIYNPTPEIFVDRTNHNDLKYLTSAIYKYNGICKKAFILKKDKQVLINECGFIPQDYYEKIERADNYGGAYVDY